MTDPFKDFLEELERRRSGGETPTQATSNGEAGDDAPPPARPRARRPAAGGGSNFTRPKLSVRSLFFPALFGLFLIGGPIIGLLTDARWFESLGAGELFWQRLQIQGALFAGSTVVSLIFLLGMIGVASLIARRGGTPPAEPKEQAARPEREPLINERGQIRVDGLGEALRDLFSAGSGGGSTVAAVGSGVLRIGALLVSLFIGAQVAANWEAISLWQNAVSFDPSGTPVVDPIFGRDI
ncbi:MAG: hypothetical protein RIS15_155, partial [Chloroflexota bacterium]